MRKKNMDVNTKDYYFILQVGESEVTWEGNEPTHEGIEGGVAEEGNKTLQRTHEANDEGVTKLGTEPSTEEAIEAESLQYGKVCPEYVDIWNYCFK